MKHKKSNNIKTEYQNAVVYFLVTKTWQSHSQFYFLIIYDFFYIFILYNVKTRNGSLTTLHTNTICWQCKNKQRQLNGYINYKQTIK